MDKVFVNVDKYGNTSAASIPIAMCEAREQGLLEKGKTVILAGFWRWFNLGFHCFKVE